MIRPVLPTPGTPNRPFYHLWRRVPEGSITLMACFQNSRMWSPAHAKCRRSPLDGAAFGRFNGAFSVDGLAHDVHDAASGWALAHGDCDRRAVFSYFLTAHQTFELASIAMLRTVFRQGAVATSEGFSFLPFVFCGQRVGESWGRLFLELKRQRTAADDLGDFALLGAMSFYSNILPALRAGNDFDQLL